MKKIVSAGPNPAWQKVLEFKEFHHGEVNRASSLVEFASGKGINFARACRCWGAAEGTVISFVGGDNGRRIAEYLRSERLPNIAVNIAAASRCCTTCLDTANRVTTELIEPAAAPSEEEAREFVAAVNDALPGAEALAIAGTLPGNMDTGFYSRLAECAARLGKLLIADLWRDLDRVAASGARFVLKINRQELAAASGETDLRAGVAALMKRFPNLAAAGITDGSGRACWADADGFYFMELPPTVSPVVNPIGCGDTASAVLTSELVNGRDGCAAMAAALGAAMANTASVLCGEFDPAVAREYTRRIKIEREVQK